MILLLVKKKATNGKMSLRRTYTLLSSKNEICVVLRKGQFLLKEIQKYFTVTTNIIILFWPLKYLATRNGLLHLIFLLVTKLIIMLLEKKILCTITVLLLHSPFFSQCYCNCNVQFFYSPTTIEKKPR